MLFVGIISWKGASRLNGGFVFQMGEGFIFKRGHPMGGIPWGASVLMGKVFEKNCKMGGRYYENPGMVKNGCGQSGHGTVKLTVKSQK